MSLVSTNILFLQHKICRNIQTMVVSEYTQLNSMLQFLKFQSGGELTPDS